MDITLREVELKTIECQKACQVTCERCKYRNTCKEHCVLIRELKTDPYVDKNIRMVTV